MTAQVKGVRTQHPDYTEMLSVWKMCEDAAEGEQAIHKGGATYLPKLLEETSDAYSSRKARTPFFNATWRTISGLKGMVFRKPPQSDLPKAIDSHLADIDAAGTSLDMFAQELTEEVLTPGRVGILVDHPPKIEANRSLVKADVVALGARPTLQKYEACQIINWKQARIGNATVTSLVVLKECAAIAGADEFAQEFEDRYRVLDLLDGKYRQRVFRINNEKDEQVGEDIFPLMNNNPLGYIPFIFVNADDCSPEVESPPLLDLVNMNIHHYQVTADWEHGCHYSGLPTLFISGYNGETDAAGNAKKIYIGGPAANSLSDPTAKAYYVEVQGDFKALQANLDSKKSEMAVLGARMLENQKTAVEAADTIQARTAGEQSQLAAMAQVISMALTQALTIFAEWAGAPGTVKYELNRDFVPAGMTAQDLTALVTAWQAGAMSDQTLFENLQKGEIIAGQTTFEEEQGRMQSRAPVLSSGAL